MRIKGTKSEENLRAAFAGESQARNKYTYYAARAREEGQTALGDLFEQMARNEMEHAKIWFELLNGVKDTDEHLLEAATGENGEWRTMYPSFAKEARQEGLEELATLFEQVGAIEQSHELVFLKEFGYLKMGISGAEKSDNELPRQIYRCVFCGHIHEIAEGEPPVACPVCKAIGAHHLVDI